MNIEFTPKKSMGVFQITHAYFPSPSPSPIL